MTENRLITCHDLLFIGFKNVPTKWLNYEGYHFHCCNHLLALTIVLIKYSLRSRQAHLITSQSWLDLCPKLSLWIKRLFTKTVASHGIFDTVSPDCAKFLEHLKVIAENDYSEDLKHFPDDTKDAPHEFTFYQPRSSQKTLNEFDHLLKEPAARN